MTAPVVIIGRACRHKIRDRVLVIESPTGRQIVGLTFTDSTAAKKFYAAALAIWQHMEDHEATADPVVAYTPQYEIEDGEPW